MTAGEELRAALETFRLIALPILEVLENMVWWCDVHESRWSHFECETALLAGGDLKKDCRKSERLLIAMPDGSSV